ncbi:MAG TPA: SRPBCC family protein [Sporichthyaceae bacterium]|nr:SRPBCC family protein [Sporichthyaceae bacterium]
MELRFTVRAHISRPVATVFEAVVDPDQLSGYFTTGGAKGRLEKGSTVSWDFHDFPGAFPVEVVDLVPNARIVLRWAAQAAAPGGQTEVTIEFEPVGDDRTLVTISEEGWEPSTEGLAASYGNCMGWSQMLSAMKAYVEYGINLREGMYV